MAVVAEHAASRRRWGRPPRCAGSHPRVDQGGRDRRPFDPSGGPAQSGDSSADRISLRGLCAPAADHGRAAVAADAGSATCGPMVELTLPPAGAGARGRRAGNTLVTKAAPGRSAGARAMYVPGRGSASGRNHEKGRLCGYICGRRPALGTDGASPRCVACAPMGQMAQPCAERAVHSRLVQWRQK